MIQKLLIILILVVAGRAEESPAHFTATCIVQTTATTWATGCRVDDLPAPEFHNRFHILLDKAPENSEKERFADYVRTECSWGLMRVKTILWGDIWVIPGDFNIQKSFTAPAFETRPQNVTISSLKDGKVEILIDEPVEDFNGGPTAPSPEWQARFLESVKKYSGAK